MMSENTLFSLVMILGFLIGGALGWWAEKRW